ncbi:hypothetical protein NEDG_00365 [Nematocida displodere]|uniref:Uncharacterized protein n=1 Tax=Nematocida displodere TaxID=1805483 RepID=A0A177EKK2_9MICR|nr:hypothetical protein NEDG_00365 [Nematocida displodere]
MQETASIDQALAERFAATPEGYIPKDPGRHELRKCGLKEDVLILQIEEALFELKLPLTDTLVQYASTRGYLHYRTYSDIRSKGMILMRTKTLYLYHLHRPNKHFTRKMTSDTFLQIVGPEETLSDVFAPTVFAISTDEAYVLIHTSPVTTENLLDETPSQRQP